MWDTGNSRSSKDAKASVRVPIPETSFLSKLLRLRKLWCKISKKRATAKTRMMMFTETQKGKACITFLYLLTRNRIKTTYLVAKAYLYGMTSFSSVLHKH